MYKFHKLLDKYYNICYNSNVAKNAGVAELADALDLGSSVNDVGVQVPSPAPCNKKI